MSKRAMTSLSISLYPEEKDAWREEADKKDLSLSAFVRKVMNTYTKALKNKREKM